MTPPVPSRMPDDDVGLLELGRGGVEDQRLSAVELVPEHGAQPVIPPLRHPGGRLRGDSLARVIVDVEVLRLEHLELEGIVLDLIATEVLAFCRRRESEPRKECGEDSGERGAVAVRASFLLLSPSIVRPASPACGEPVHRAYS